MRMSKKPPRGGDVIPAEKFHISKCNVRHGEPFGKDEEDKKLIYQVGSTKKLVEAFKARPEGNGYGVYAGGRRFLAAKEAGFTEFMVGRDVIISDIGEEEAMDESFIENIGFLRKKMDPVKRAQRINERISSSPGGLRSYARRVGIAPQTLSEWLKVLDLSEKMQDTVSKGLLYYTDAVRVARMDFSKDRQDKLADTLEEEGMDEFKKEVERYSEKKLKRGIPKGKYVIARITFDKVYDPDMTAWGKLQKLAEGKHVKVDEYCKSVLVEHAKNA